VTPAETESKALVEAGDALQADGDLNGAIEAYSRALALQPSAPVRAYALVCRGSAKEEAKDLDGALADYDQAIALVPDDPDGWYLRGLIHQVRKEWLAALSDFNAAIARDDENADFFEARALTRLFLDDWEGANEDLARVVVLAVLRLRRHVGRLAQRDSSGVHERDRLTSRRKRRSRLARK
jgi:tetratricopeptide (TPR) repeat protein